MILKNVSVLNKMFANSKKIMHFKKCSKFLKTVCELEKCLLIHKMFAHSENVHAFQKVCKFRKESTNREKIFVYYRIVR